MRDLAELEPAASHTKVRVHLIELALVSRPERGGQASNPFEIDNARLALDVYAHASARDDEIPHDHDRESREGELERLFE